MAIALKEANETDYWLSLLKDTDYTTEKMFLSLSEDCIELIKLLIATVKTTQVSR
jgi:four helix bundle protein